ncbi:cytochrome P450 [Colletotrichum navitas]|uniref:Cytochrome P450 n=1 Tax=Colletotrichum navitas TaxID=681940 RepID=A0AAD8QDS2_9PEZI|nr:cytochrome P450 [Colletotrichum navitas]KAK1600660.1 cytochrome P450 [Colletotrichum navitas]
MGLVEDVLEYVNLKVVVIFSVAAWWLWIAVRRFDETIRLRRLAPGVRGQPLESRLPGGIDFIYKAVRATMNHKNVEFWTDRLSVVKGWTGERRLLFGMRIIFTADPENIKAILAAQFSDYGKGEPFHQEWNEFLGDSIFTTDGDQWHASRQLIRPQFIKDRVSDLHTFESHIQILLKAIANGGALNGEDQPVNMDAVDGKVLDISEPLFRYTLDVATDFLLGQDVKSLSTPRQEFAEAFNEVQRVQNIIARASTVRFLVPRFSFRSGLKVINRFVNKFIEKALRLSPEELASKTKSDQGYTFLHELASFTRDRKVLRDQIVAVLLAGRDTTAATLSWALYELGRHPEAVRKLRAEIIEQVGLERAPTYADLKNMKYLQNVMNETLRLYPVVPFNVRLALKDTTLPVGGGPDGTLPLAVLKDTPIGYSTFMMQRREDLYPPVSETSAHPSEFSPERWFNWQPKPWTYIPFNGGPRICIGQQFALTEMGYTLCRLFQNFERVESYMDAIDGGHPKLKAEIVLQPGDGVKVAFWRAGKA